MNALDAAVAGFVAVFASVELADEVAARLNCVEVDALAQLLRTTGETGAADAWITAHATDDDEGDEHYNASGRA